MVEFPHGADHKTIQHIQKIIEDIPGESPVRLVFEEEGWMIEVSYKKPTSMEAEPMIRKLVGLS